MRIITIETECQDDIKLHIKRIVEYARKKEKECAGAGKSFVQGLFQQGESLDIVVQIIRAVENPNSEYEII